MRFTALGVFIGIYPLYTWVDGVMGYAWHVVGFKKSGHWQSSSWFKTEKMAQQHRSYLFALHRRLAKERAKKSRRRRVAKGAMA